MSRPMYRWAQCIVIIVVMAVGGVEGDFASRIETSSSHAFAAGRDVVGCCARGRVNSTEIGGKTSWAHT